jgi:2-keto-4-pentenoate hydratase/2-oxohepta-3-ene-1,7-dioic acid hydratase in catechol pathway
VAARDHSTTASTAAELELAAPDAPVLFAKFRNALAGHEQPIPLPAVTSAVYHEGELAVVIGRRCHGVTPEQAPAHVAGAMAFNDISAPDLQFCTSQWLAGKSLDPFAPAGPTSSSPTSSATHNC